MNGSFLLDTDVIIDFLKGKNPGADIISSFLGKPCFISIITWIEINLGFTSEYYENQSEQFDQFIKDFNLSFLFVDIMVAKSYIASIKSLNKTKNIIAPMDLFIASTAIIHDLTLVTRNLKHFAKIKDLKIYKSPL